jgi:hypothetical protein
MGLQQLACWDCGFVARRWYGVLSLVSVVCCQVEVFASGWSLVHRSPTDCGVSKYDQKSSTRRRPCPTMGRRAIGGGCNRPNYLYCVTLPKLACIIYNYFQEVALYSRFVFYFTILPVCRTGINYGVERRKRLS